MAGVLLSYPPSPGLPATPAGLVSWEAAPQVFNNLPSSEMIEQRCGSFNAKVDENCPIKLRLVDPGIFQQELDKCSLQPNVAAPSASGAAALDLSRVLKSVSVLLSPSFCQGLTPRKHNH